MTHSPTKAADAVRQFAQEVLGRDAHDWLKTPNPRLDGKMPSEIINAYPGKVEQLLITMQDGDF